MADRQSFSPRLASFYEPVIGRSESVTGLADAFLYPGSLEILFEREATKTRSMERFPSTLKTDSKDESQIPQLNDEPPDHRSPLVHVSQTAKLSSTSPVQSHSQA